MPEASFEDVIWILGREAVLQSALLCFDNLDCLLLEDVNARSRVEALLEAARACSWLIFLSSSRAWNAPKMAKRFGFHRSSLSGAGCGRAKEPLEEDLFEI